MFKKENNEQAKKNYCKPKIRNNLNFKQIEFAVLIWKSQEDFVYAFFFEN